MDELLLRKMALGSCIIGMIFLLIFHFFFSVGDIGELYQGKRVQFTGKVVSVIPSPGMTSFSMQVQDEYLFVQAFTANLTLFASEYVSVVGTVSDVKKKTVVAESIEYVT